MVPSKTSNPALVSGIVLVLVVLMAAGVIIFTKSSKDSDAVTDEGTATETATEDAAATPTPAASAAGSDTPSAATAYKDGTYSATGHYISPGGQESIGVRLTVAGDKVTAVTVTSNAQSPEAKEYQQRFISGVQSAVVGKSLATLQLTKVSGSSLTPKGFNDALAAIKAQAAS